MELCSRCKKRVAVVFVSRVENGKTISEGICLKCARELHLKPVEDMIEQMGLSDEDLERMDMEMDGMLDEDNLGNPEDGGFGEENLALMMSDVAEDVEKNDGDDKDKESDSDESGNGRAPAVDFKKLFAPLMGMQLPGMNRRSEGETGSKTERKGGNKEKKRKFLGMYCSDLTSKARDGLLDRVIGREKEIERSIQILCRRQKNNPCLIGEPGVGKTAIAEAIAQQIADGKAPWKLQNKEIFLLDLTALVAGTQFRGQFESRMKGLIDEIRSNGNIILVIDEVHMIAGTGNAEGGMNAANILKPALSKGEIQVIGATTLEEYRKYIESDTALERRFQPVIVEEPSLEDSVKILSGIKGYYEQFHGIRIPDAVIESSVRLAERYITDRFLPDKAIDLLDEAAAYLVLHTPLIHDVEMLAEDLKCLVSEREALENAENSDNEKENEEKYKRLADIRVKEINDRKRFEELSAERDKIELSVDDLAHVIEIWTGVPAGTITEHEFARVDKLAERLRKNIIGQDKAIDSVAKAIKRSRAGVSSVRKPVSFIFAGSTGVGKTALVKALASDLFNSPESLIRLDMSEFMEKHSVSKIIGSPPGYVGYDEAGQLTEKIRRKPYSVILFDEIEKAHPDVLNILLQVLDEGRITDAHGRTVSFENAVIIMTTNAGSSNNTNTPGFGGSGDELIEDRTMKALSEFLRPEFINRVDEIITFRSLDKDDFKAIAAIMLGELRDILSEKNVVLEWTQNVEAFIAEKSYSSKFGARNMRRYVQTHLEDEIADLIISSYDKKVTGVCIDTNGDELNIKLLSDAVDICALRSPDSVV